MDHGHDGLMIVGNGLKLDDVGGHATHYGGVT